MEPTYTATKSVGDNSSIAFERFDDSPHPFAKIIASERMGEGLLVHTQEITIWNVDEMRDLSIMFRGERDIPHDDKMDFVNSLGKLLGVPAFKCQGSFYLTGDRDSGGVTMHVHVSEQRVTGTVRDKESLLGGMDMDHDMAHWLADTIERSF